eukprot:TRINITY_DN3057_c1_g1_i1.p1 TRINITY_DN3057_c1_g1~~TRINITY_DN3057_c1_g1_i1.p1  ORF type:complete len:414 (+),score=70.58 TRINITY_DN3057_c1_g1_i1:533-1774(+)
MKTRTNPNGVMQPTPPAEVIETKVGKDIPPSRTYAPVKRRCNGDMAFFSSPLAGSKAEARHLYGSGVAKMPVRLPPIRDGLSSHTTKQTRSDTAVRRMERSQVSSEIDKFDGHLQQQRQQELVDDENQLVALLFGIQRASTETLLSRLTQVQSSELSRHLSDMGLSGASLQREEFTELLTRLLGDKDKFQAREVDLVFSLFDCNDSKTLDPNELQVGLKLLAGSNTTELVMKRIHTILSLSKRTVVSTQFITRFDMQLLFNALTRFWLVAEGVDKSKECSEILSKLLDSFSWHQAKVPAETLRQKIFESDTLTNLFCVAAPLRESFNVNDSPSSPPVNMTVAQSYFLSRSPQLLPTDRPLRAPRDLRPVLATPPNSFARRNKVLSPKLVPAPPKGVRKNPGRGPRVTVAFGPE